MAALQNRHQPAFFWQGMLIMLPVVILAVVNLISLRSDEQAAENDARKRAAENVQSLARAMRVSVGEELQRYLGLQQLWMHILQFEDAKKFADVVSWEHDFPALKLAELVMPQQGTIVADGRQLEPPDFPEVPAPPKWFLDLSPEQRSYWSAMRTARSSNEIDSLRTRFIDSQPPAEAISLARLLTAPPDELASTSGVDLTETGLSFQEIAIHQMLTATNPLSHYSQ